MKNIIYKLSMWSLSFILVVTFLFVKVEFDFSHLRTSNAKTQYVHTIDSEPMFRLIDVVSIDVSNNVIQPKASLLLTVIGYVALSVFTSLGAYYTAEFIRDNATLFTNWYVDWYNNAPTLEDGKTPEEIAAWQQAQKIPAYLQNTGQLNNDGSLKNNNVVLPEEYLKGIYESASYYINDYLDAGGIDWKEYNFTDGSTTWKEHYPLIETVNILQFQPASYIKLMNVTPNTYLLRDYLWSFNASEVTLNSDAYRIQIVLSSKTSSLQVTRYSRTFTEYEMNTIRQANGFIYAVTTSYIYMFPLYWQKDWSYSVANKIELAYSSAYTNTAQNHGITINGAQTLQTVQVGVTDDMLIDLTDGFPGSWDVEDGNYYSVPIIDDVTDSTPPPVITPIPIENEDPYIYNPPIPGTGSVDMDWTDLVNPTTPAPTATAENTLNGGIFQALGDWIVATFFGAINSIMGFWEAFVNNLFTVWNDMVNWWKQILPSTWFTDFWTEFADAMTGLFVPQDLDVKFNDLMDFFELKLGLLLYPLQVISDIFTRFANVTGIDRITFNEFWLMGYLLIPTFYIDFGDLIAQYSWLGYIFGLVKIFFTSLLIFQFLMFLYGTYESMRDA